MLLKIVYLLVRQVLGLAVLIFRGDGAKEAELLSAPARERGAAPQRRPDPVRAGLTGCGSPHLCVPITSSTSCDQPILVDHATDASLFADAVLAKVNRLG